MRALNLLSPSCRGCLFLKARRGAFQIGVTFLPRVRLFLDASGNGPFPSTKNEYILNSLGFSGVP
jgi:hypothetical protein